MTGQEEMALRELAAKPHYLPQVAAALGPLSLWSRAGIEAEINRAVEAEREACIKVCMEANVQAMDFTGGTYVGGYFANAIKQRGETK